MSLAVSPVLLVVALIAAQRLAELAYAARNTRALLRAGAVEVGRNHYLLFVVLHSGLLISILWVVPFDYPARSALLILLVALQFARLWVICSLGRFWTTRIISLPSAPLVRRGPYRFLRHPNYLVVALEVAVLPLAFDAVTTAVVFSLANGALLWWRIREEEAVLAPRRRLAVPRSDDARDAAPS